MSRRTRIPFTHALLALLSLAQVHDAAGASAELDQEYLSAIRPVLNRYCLDCHSTEKQKGDLDLERFTNLTEVLKHPRVWQGVVDQITLDEMPPKDKPQPAREERSQLLGWIDRALHEAALARAGDPGPVVLRRLNNAEYTYTLRDLTGVESLEPAREFPGDSAAGEGFMNTGNSLVMSPTLLDRYLDAARQMVKHAVLLPDGFRFSPSETRRDWTEEILAEIRNLYRTYTDSAGADRVNLQGIVFDTNEGGRLPVERYLQATLEVRARLESRQEASGGNDAAASSASSLREALHTVANQNHLSTRYLESLWHMLTGTDSSSILTSIRNEWRKAKPGDVAELVRQVTDWQKALWKFSSVGHIGKVGGPKAWMEPVNPAIEGHDEADYDAFRQWFPSAVCYPKIVPVDEVVTLTLFYREDHHLARLMLTKDEAARLDRLWDELHYVSQDSLTLVDAFEQLWQYATQDADPTVFEPMRKPIQERAAAFRQRLLDTEPAHVDQLVAFAARAYRRPLTAAEASGLRGFYRKLREADTGHEEAFRMTLARLFVSPSFLYRVEHAAPGRQAAPVTDWELASRLSYFLWSSMPDSRLMEAAAEGRLRDPAGIAAEARRMLRDPRVRRLATEFACAWLHIHDFESLDEKSERHFPTFASVRGAMYEESIRFFTDLFQRDLPLVTIFDSDHTFLNEALAAHYGIPEVRGDEWRRVDGVRKFGRGGVLGMGATLAKQAGASRTSPILRGNWVAEVLLGDKLPRPPKDVPVLPEDEATESLTVRELVERHTMDPRCAGCHARIDGYGFALEGYDAIGRARTRDLADRVIETRATLRDGTVVDGVAELRDYLLGVQRTNLFRQFFRKLLGYALGRGVQLSDQPLLESMLEAQARNPEYGFSAAVEAIVTSSQFRNIRGIEMAADE